MLTKKSKFKQLIQFAKYGFSIAVIIYQSIQKINRIRNKARSYKTSTIPKKQIGSVWEKSLFLSFYPKEKPIKSRFINTEI